MKVDVKPSNQLNFKILYAIGAAYLCSRVPALAGMQVEMAELISAVVGVAVAWLLPDVKLGT